MEGNFIHHKSEIQLSDRERALVSILESDEITTQFFGGVADLSVCRLEKHPRYDIFQIIENNGGVDQVVGYTKDGELISKFQQTKGE